MEITSVPREKQTHWWGQWEEPQRYYTKYLDVEGIVIIGSDSVDDNIFYKAKEVVLKVTSKHLQFRRDLSGTRIMLAARGTSIQIMSTNMWEYWAEGVKLWTHSVGIGRQFETKEAFREHDSGLAGILDNWLHVGGIPYEY